MRRKPHKATQGWCYQDTLSGHFEIILEGVLGDETLRERSRLYSSAVVERLKAALAMSELAASRGNLVVLLIDEPLQLCMKWLNEYISRYALCINVLQLN